MAVIAVAGGTGGLGSNVVKGCAANPKHKVIVVSRSSSKTPEWLEQLKNVQVRKADYASEESLTAALEGADTVCSSLGLDWDEQQWARWANKPWIQVLCTFTVTDATWAEVQIRVLNAALAAGAKRFTPCDWGYGWPNYHRVQILSAQPPVWDACRAAAARRPGQFEWAAFHPGGFMNYLGIGSGNDEAVAGLKEGADFLWDVEKMKATLPMTKGGYAPIITLTELSDIGRAVSVACELPFGQWKEQMGIAGDVIAVDKVVEIVDKVRGGKKMQVERVPYEQVVKRAAEAEEIFEKMWWQLYEAMASEQEDECVFNANVNRLEGVGKLQTAEEFVTKYWAGQ